MNLFSKYPVKIKHYNHIFEKTAKIYQDAVDFYKFPSYLRRAVISDAIGKVSSYKSRLANWKENPKRKAPSIPKAGKVYPAMFRYNMYIQIDDYTAKIKVYIRNTWDWITVSLKKSDIDYILHHCATRKACVPTLQKRGKEWFLDFAFEEQVELFITFLLSGHTNTENLHEKEEVLCRCRWDFVGMEKAMTR